MLTSIEPAKDDFSITWNLGRRCNFECSYCPPRLHDKISSHKSLEQLQTIWSSIYEKTAHLNKKYKISLTGGEITLNPNLLDFLQWIHYNYSHVISSIGYTTNGSATTKLYTESIKYVNWISFSTHLEFMNYKKFTKNVLATHIASIKHKKHVQVNIMNENTNSDIEHIVEYCVKHRIFYSINELQYEPV